MPSKDPITNYDISSWTRAFNTHYPQLGDSHLPRSPFHTSVSDDIPLSPRLSPRPSTDLEHIHKFGKMEGFTIGKPMSLTERRASMHNVYEDGDLSPTRATLTLNTSTNNVRLPSRVDKVVQSRPRGPPTPNMTTPSADPDSPTHSSHDPPPPPTPAASPGPDHPQPDWKDAGDQEDYFLSKIRSHFKVASSAERHRILADLLNLCTSQQLSFVRQYVDPLLKKDPFTSLPNEICLRVCIAWCFLDLTNCNRFCLVSMTRKSLHEHHRYRSDGENYWQTMLHG